MQEKEAHFQSYSKYYNKTTHRVACVPKTKLTYHKLTEKSKVQKA